MPPKAKPAPAGGANVEVGPEAQAQQFRLQAEALQRQLGERTERLLSAERALEELRARLRLPPLLGARRGAACGRGGAGVHATVSLPELAGLDLRLVRAGDGPPAVWVDSAAEMADEVDASMNPEDPKTHAGKQQSLSCASVAGLQIASTVRMRMAGRVRR